MTDNSGSKTWRFGKYVAFEYPEIYFLFWSKVNKEHPDLLRAMQLAQVSVRDSSVILFLNKILGTTVATNWPMEIGYKVFYDALDRRIKTNIAVSSALSYAQQEAEQIAKDGTLAPDEVFPETPTERKLNS